MPLPSELPGLAQWLRASDVPGVDGDQVAAWPDLSGHGRALVQATGSFRPVLRTGVVNGLPVLRFDGVDDALGNTSWRPMGPLTMWVVAAHRRDPLPATQDIVDLVVMTDVEGGTSQTLGWTTYNTFHNRAGRELKKENGPGTIFKNGIAGDRQALALGEWHIGTLVGDATTSSLGFQIAASPMAGAIFFGQVDVAEVVVYPRAVTAHERRMVEEYLGARYAITVPAVSEVGTARPGSTLAAGGWTTGSGTLHGAVSDQSTGTLITGTGA